MQLLLLTTCCLVVTVRADSKARLDKRAPQYTHYHGGNDIQITVYPNEQIVREGGAVIFDCRARSDDNTVYPTVRWTKVGGPLPRTASESNGRLTISPTSLTDSGKYVCIASHEGHTAEAYAQLNIQSYGPQEIQRAAGSFGGRCMADEKTCQNGECVKSDYVCDGEYDCRDRSDEQNCPPARSCEPNEFKCFNSRCVQKMWLCDGDDDCGDNSDEVNCGGSRPGDACQLTEYSCRDGRQCVPQSFQCDGANDCRDGSDEVGCVQPTIVQPPETSKEVLPGTMFTLHCRAVAVPEAYINWRRNWGPVCDPPRCTQTSEGGVGVLTVKNAQDIDQGAYTCEAMNVKGRVLATPDCIVHIVGLHDPPQPRQFQPTSRPHVATCNVAGSIDHYPDSRTGQCRCKQYARGPLCDQCDASSFYLHEKAPQGCLKCFCSGVTRQCQSSRWCRAKVRRWREGQIEMRNRTLETTGAQNETVYWHLPDTFLGDKVTAYGGAMSFEFQYNGTGPFVSDPLVVLKGNEITLVYRHSDHAQKIVPYRPNIISIDMYETSWEREDGHPSTREHLLMTLADLESIRIRAVHVDHQYWSSLGDVTLDVAVQQDNEKGVIALEVEDCQCPRGYIGLSCQDCADGYERTGGGLYLGTCEPKVAGVQCSDGAVSPKVGPDGRCQCKTYVTGPTCDQCLPHSFFLCPANPQGCIPCFCSGVTQNCFSSSWYRHVEEVDFSKGGRDIFEVTTSDVRSPYSPASRANIGPRELTFSSFDEARDQTLYWKLGERFLGNKVTTYGGYIKYVFHFSGTGSPNREADVILRGNDITLHYIHRNQFHTDLGNTVGIIMYEDRWQRVDGQPATREHLLMTLADLDTFLIKMSYVDRTETSSLIRVEMQYANERDSGLVRAHEVEMCRCPPGYIGTSCEDCAPGYSRSGGGLYLGLCQRCECHGHASKCDLEYGYCIDCQHHTEGDQCERCKPGFVGEARRGTPNDCQPIQSRPLCQCYNHSPRGCDSLGRCLLCEHNTEGEYCEKCKRGFYGKATDGTPYDCSPCPCPGASECYLDALGEVTCRKCPPGFHGRLCDDECPPGYTKDRADPSRRCKPIGLLQVQILSPKSIAVSVGQTARWHCDIVGERPHAYNLVWTKVGSTSLPPNARVYNGELIITNVQESDVGQYRCTATSTRQLATDDGYLRIREPGGSLPQPVVDPSFQTVRVGDPARIRCTAWGDPPPHISWGFRVPGGPLRGDVVDSNGELSIQSANMNDAGEYICKASNQHGTVNAPPARIDVTERLVVSVRDETTSRGLATMLILAGNTQAFEVGQSAELVCASTGSQLVDRMQWVRVNSSLPSDAQQTESGILRFSSFEASHAGEYECLGYHRANLVGSATVRVNVRSGTPSTLLRPDGPIVRVSEPAIRVVQSGGSIVLICDISTEWMRYYRMTEADYQVKWTKVRYGQISKISDDYESGPILHLKNVRLDDGGEFRAVLTRNIDGAVIAESTVIYMIVAQRYWMQQHDAILSPFDLKATAKITCPIYSIPGSTIIWSKSQGESLPGKAIENGNVLEIHDFDEKDQGIYICRMTINQDSVQGFVRASIWVPETIVEVLTEASQESWNLGDTSWFDCKVQGDPTATVTWSKEGSASLPDNAEVKGNRLLLTSLREDNSGTYKCRAQTKAGPLEISTVVSVGSVSQP